MKNQHGYYLTDQEFADLWQKFPSPTLMARETKTSARAILNRRRTVEVRLGIKLEVGVDLKGEHNNKLKQERLERLKAKNEAKLEQAPVSVRRGTHLRAGLIVTGKQIGRAHV